MEPAERHKLAIIEYIGDPDNPFPNRGQLSEICGITDQGLRKHFSPADLSEIERQGLDLRRTRYIKQAANIDAALMRKAEEGDAQAAKLFYQRIENWSEKTKVDNTITIDEIKIELVSPKE
jgi:hypothetical protein